MRSDITNQVMAMQPRAAEAAVETEVETEAEEAGG